MIYLGADHGGWHLKEEIKKYLQELGREYEDLGNQQLDPQDDYPDFALAVARKVKETQGKGILICGTGSGMTLAANRIKEIRAVNCWDEFTALQSREHLKANILCLGGKVIDLDTAKKIVRLWLKTNFSDDKRHIRRLRKIADVGGGTSHIEVVPTIIAQDFEELKEKLKKVESYVSWVQLDVMDGQFVDNATWNNPLELKELKSQAKWEVHLMIDRPEARLDNWIASGVKRIIFHYESTDKHRKIIKEIKQAGLKVGLAINPETSIEMLDKFIDRLDLILVMTVHPGEGGQSLLPKTLDKIKQLRQKYPSVNIEVDGGINLETAPLVIQAGANFLASGSAIFKSQNIKDTINQLKGEKND